MPTTPKVGSNAAPPVMSCDTPLTKLLTIVLLLPPLMKMPYAPQVPVLVLVTPDTLFLEIVTEPVTASAPVPMEMPETGLVELLIAPLMLETVLPVMTLLLTATALVMLMPNAESAPEVGLVMLLTVLPETVALIVPVASQM